MTLLMSSVDPLEGMKNGQLLAFGQGAGSQGKGPLVWATQPCASLLIEGSGPAD